MRILLLIGIIFFLSCDEEIPLTSSSSNNQNLNISIDTQGPSIKWLNPRFDALINTVSELECKIEDASKVIKIELYIDSMLVNVSALKTSDSTYKFNLLTLDYQDDQEILLFVKAFDDYDNFSSSDVLRVTIDNKYIYPEPIVLYPLDSLIVDSVIVGYELKWWYSGYEFFKRYIVKKSNTSSMLNSIEIFSTDEKSKISYLDFDINSSEIIYYQILVEDTFGKFTEGNVINNSTNSIPPQINIQSVNYNSSSIFINWNPIAFDTYFSHRIMFSNKPLKGSCGSSCECTFKDKIKCILEH